LIDIDSYDLHVVLRSNGLPFSCRGKLHLTNAGPTAIDRVAFHLHSELTIREVLDGRGVPLERTVSVEPYDLSYTGDIALHTVRLPRPLRTGGSSQLVVRYEGAFSPSSARSPSDYMRIDEDGAYLRGAGYSYWFPVAEGWDWNTAAGFEIAVQAPAPWRPLAFGTLLDEEVGDDRVVSRWATDAPWPLLFGHLAAAEWEVHDGAALRVYHRRSKRSRDAAAAYAETGEKLLSFCRTRYGNASSMRRIHLAELCRYGGISAGNVIGIPDDRFPDITDEGRSEATLELLAHELVHGFVIPAVVSDVPGSALLIEGFPSYFHALALEAAVDNGFYARFVRRAWAAYRQRKASERLADANVPPEIPLLALRDEDIGRYKDVFLLDDRFIALIDRVRTVVGPERFLRGTRSFFDCHRTDPARFDDFIAALESASGTPLRGFADRWFGSTEPLPDAWSPDGGIRGTRR